MKNMDRIKAAPLKALLCLLFLLGPPTAVILLGQSTPAGEAPASTEAKKPAPGPPALTDDEKKDLTILNQAMVIQQQRFQLLQAEVAKTQQEYSRLAGERDQRLARAKRDHKWGDDVSCNPDELACARVPAQEGKSKK